MARPSGCKRLEITITGTCPTTRSGQFNFTASVEAGLRIGRPNAGVLLIYRLHHISNAGTAKENPGVASHLLTVGFALGRRE